MATKASDIISLKEVPTSTLDKHFRFFNGALWAVEGSDYTVANLWNE